MLFDIIFAVRKLVVDLTKIAVHPEQSSKRLLVSKSFWFHPPLAMFCAMAAGFASAALYVWIFRDDFAGPPPPRHDLTAPSTRRIMEAIIVFWSAAAPVGQWFYRLVGAREEADITRRSVGGYALFLHVVGGIYMLGSLIANLAAGQRPPIRDAVTLIVGLVSLVQAYFEWWKPPFASPTSEKQSL
ncbi:MAG: hypothetical protein IAF94_15050 [Pirellulaceae bacterium]|nr:hypothetical protein [Pirellulaceae bacterium]